MFNYSVSAIGMSFLFTGHFVNFSSLNCDMEKLIAIFIHYLVQNKDQVIIHVIQ